MGDKSSAPQNLISAITARKMLRKGCQGYLALVRDTTAEKTSISDVPVACEFPDIFSDELPGLPPHREIEFYINVILGMDWLSQHYATVDCRKKR